MLSPLQLRIASIVTQLPESADFVLAGGGALVARGDVDRTTRDLDYFARSADQVPRLAAALGPVLHGAGFEVVVMRSSDSFARLAISDGTSTTEVDLAHDYRLLPPEQTSVGATLAGEELAIDKVLALFDRAEARDFIDLDAVVERWGLDHLCRRAKDKDSGFDRGVLAEQLVRFDRLPAREFQIPDDEHRRLRAVVSTWQAELRRPSQAH